MWNDSPHLDCVHHHRKGEYDMNLLHWIFRRKPKKEIPPMPSWDAIVEMMRNEYLDAFADEIVEVFYSKDSSLISLKQSINSTRMSGNIFVRTISTPAVREVMLRIVKCLRA